MVAQHVGQHVLVARLAGQRERLVRQGAPALVVGVELELHGLKTQQPRAASRVGVALDRAPERSHPLLVHGAERAREPAVVGERRTRHPLRVTQLLRDPARAQQRLAELRPAGLPLSLAETDHQIAALGRIVIGRLLEQLERLGEPSRRLVRRQLGQRLVASLLAVGDRLPGVDRGRGGRPVARELPHARSGVVAAEVLERLRHAPVEARPPGHPQDVVERVVDQVVDEGERSRPARALLHEQRLGRAVEHVDQAVLVVPVTHASRSRSKSRPITAAALSTARQSSPSRSTRRPTTSRTL